jgi:transcriptional regulator with XRE-family HTH domain
MTAEVNTIAEHLQAWRMSAGKPGTREIAVCAGVSHSTVAGVLSGARLPSWPVLERIAACLGGDSGELRSLWAAAKTGGAKGAEREVTALSTTLAVLSALDAPARTRVLAYLGRYFSETSPSPAG